MREYRAPGVHIEKITIGAKPIAGVSTSTVGFLGQTERGPTDPRLVGGMAGFLRLYGTYLEGSYLAYAVDGFFKNGGQRCFVGRIVGTGATPASAVVGPITFTAIGPGSWGDRVAIRIENASTDRSTDPARPQDNTRFKLIVAYWSGGLPDFTAPADGNVKKRVAELMAGATLEVYDELSTEAASSVYYAALLAERQRRSNLVHLASSRSGRPANNTDPLFTPLANAHPGAALTRDDFLGDLAAAPADRTGLRALAEVDEISILSVPDLHVLDAGGASTLQRDIITHCETRKDRFAILEAPMGTGNIGNLYPPVPSKYAAYYYPWIQAYDPRAKGLKMLPPGGHIAGIYARSDTERGVHKAPANDVVRDAQNVEFTIDKPDQDLLNSRGVNCIRVFPGRGIRVWGARTCSDDPLWKYINVRRLFIYLEESIAEGTQWVVFEPNDEKLWARVRQTIVPFLTRVWSDGALMGKTQEQAFFVKCDRTTMTQNDIDNGRVIVLIGVCPVKPAEFVVFRIAQWQGGSAVSE